MEVVAEAVLHTVSIEPLGDLRFGAERISDDRTGIHARLAIHFDYADGATLRLAWGRMNVERDEDRTRMANSAHKNLSNGAGEEFTNKMLKRELDTFCAGIWDCSLAIHAPEYMAGLEEPEIVQPLVYPYVVQGGGTILFAPPGRGKSITTLLLGVSVDAGLTELFDVRIQAKTLIVNLERSRQSLRSRLSNVNAALGLPRTRPMHFLNARGRSLTDVFGTIDRYVNENDIKFVMLDSISRAGYGDLNENRPVNAIVDGMNQLTDTWFGIAHTPRQDESHLYGSVHFEAGADVLVKLSTQTEKDYMGVGLETVKANDMKTSEGMALYRYEFDDFGLTTVKPGSISEFPELAQEARKSIAEELKDLLLEMGNMTATAAARELQRPRSKVSTILRKDKRFVAGPKHGKEQPYGVRIEPSFDDDTEEVFE